MPVDQKYPDLAHLIETQLRVFPGHESYLSKRVDTSSNEELTLADDVAKMVRRIAGDDLAACCEDYAWLSGIVLEEELFFRRNGRYRLSSFQDALEQVYSQREFMSRYMNGLLLSQVWWKNHTAIMGFYRDTFLARAPQGFTHLEVGPGHGMLLAMSAESPRCGSVEGWDISDASLTNTTAALDAVGADTSKIALKKIDIFEAPEVTFDSVVFSEVLEHLEEPLAALQVLYERVKSGGRIFINAPVNSPAPDHLYLFSTPEEVVDMVSQAGFVIEETLFAPCTGATLERARRLSLTISTGVIGTRA